MSGLIDPEVDKVFNIYRQYVRISDPQTAGYLTLAHLIDHMVSVIKDTTDLPPKAVLIDSVQSNS